MSKKRVAGTVRQKKPKAPKKTVATIAPLRDQIHVPTPLPKSGAK